MRLIRRLGPWRLPMAWAAVILVATSLPIPARPLPGAELPLDKVAHFLLYLGLGWGSARALYREGRRGLLPVTAAVAAGALFAALDEAHQGWILGRTPSVADWAADVAGMAVGISLAALGGRPGDDAPEEREEPRSAQHVRCGESEGRRKGGARSTRTSSSSG